MMKHYLLYILIGLAVIPACGQGVTDYYQVTQNRQQYQRLLNRYGGPQIRDRWYVALDGFVKTDRAQLDNAYDGLIENNTVSKAGWVLPLAGLTAKSGQLKQATPGFLFIRSWVFPKPTHPLRHGIPMTERICATGKTPCPVDQ